MQASQKLLRILLLICACGLAGCGGESAGRNASEGGAQAPLRQSGTWFIDAQGRAVILHGVNITVPEYPGEVNLAERYRDDAQFLAGQGFNVVRLAMFFSGLMPAPGVFDPGYLENYAGLVQVLTDAGLYVMVDAHQDLYANKYYGRGMPEWMAVDNGLPNLPNQNNLFLNYALNPAVQRTFDNFWNNAAAPDGQPLQTHYGAALQQLARRFKDNPLVLGYELMNEPFPGSQFATCASPLGCPLFDAGALTNFSRRMADMIREVDADKIVFYEPNVTFDFGANTWLGDVEDDNAALSFHVYCLGNQFGEFPVDNSAVCEPVGERPQFGYARTHAENHGKGLILTEFGHFTAPVDADTSSVARRSCEIADDYMTSWAYWHYDGVGSYQLVPDAAQPPAGSNLYGNIVDAVVRVYPRVIAGTPLSWSYDAQGKQFNLSYSTARVAGGTFGGDALTEIAVPPRLFPDGYVVEVSGARVTSPANSASLTLTALPEATQIGVIVRAP